MSSPQQSEQSKRGDDRSRGEPLPQHLQELQESKQDLILKVQALKKELQDWRCQMDGQVMAYRTELSSLQQSLQGDLQGLRSDLQELKQRIRSQLGTSEELIGALSLRGDAVTRQLAAAAQQQQPVPAAATCDA